MLKNIDKLLSIEAFFISETEKAHFKHKKKEKKCTEYQKCQVLEKKDNWQLQLGEVLMETGREEMRRMCLWSKIDANSDSVT